MWILLEKIDDKKRQFLIDSSGPCEVGTETLTNFQLYLERKAWTGSGASADTSGELFIIISIIFTYHITHAGTRMTATTTATPRETTTPPSCSALRRVQR